MFPLIEGAAAERRDHLRGIFDCGLWRNWGSRREATTGIEPV
jgi:hypothetical protein